MAPESVLYVLCGHAMETISDLASHGQSEHRPQTKPHGAGGMPGWAWIVRSRAAMY